MNKDMVWHELFDRMLNDKCPICDLIHDRTVRSMDGFLYESVNDVSLRKNICTSNGLCSYHAFMLMDMGDPLAHALIYNDLLDNAINNIQKTVVKQNEQYQDHEGCLFCEREKESEDTYLKAFIDAYMDDEFKERYSESGMLCMPHLELIKNSKKQNTNIIIKETIKKYQSLRNDLSEIQRKNDYRFSHEPWTEKQRSAWKKSVEIINGNRGIRK